MFAHELFQYFRLGADLLAEIEKLLKCGVLQSIVVCVVCLEGLR